MPDDLVTLPGGGGVPTNEVIELTNMFLTLACHFLMSHADTPGPQFLEFRAIARPFMANLFETRKAKGRWCQGPRHGL